MKNLVFFGPSNQVGVGSVWRQTAAEGYSLRWHLSDRVGEEEMSKLIQHGAVSTCQGTFSSDSKFRPSLLLGGGGAPVSADVAMSLDRARVVIVNAAAWSMDYLKEGRFEDLVMDSEEGGSWRGDLLRGDRLIMAKALRVHGLSVECRYDASTSAEMQAKYGDLARSIGDAKAGITARWKDGATLLLECAGSCVVAGELSSFVGGGFAGASPGQKFALRPVVARPDAPVVLTAREDVR